MSQLKKYPKIHGDIALLTKPKAITVATGDAVALYRAGRQGSARQGQADSAVPTAAEGEGSIEAITASGNRLVLGIQGGKVGKKRGAGKVFVLTFNGKGLK